MDLLTEYECWRGRHDEGWGLAWYLAAEVMQRFYVSHGIDLVTIAHTGLGYYGISMQFVPCPQHRQRVRLGRFSMGGDVENWRAEGPRDQDLMLIERAKRGESVAPMVEESIGHMGLAPIPYKPHAGCMHHRRGASAVLVFRLAAALALRHDAAVQVTNDAELLERDLGQLDRKRQQREHPGWTLLKGPAEGQVVLSNDGRVLEPAGAGSLWTRYMQGESEDALAEWLETKLGLRRDG